MNESSLNFVVALNAEANPIVKFYNLKRDHSIAPFEVYRNNNLSLIVSGIGKLNAATATAFLAGVSQQPSSECWLNVGIAGSRKKIGNAYIINSILDWETNKQHYPSICFDSHLPQLGAITVSEPSKDYDDNSLVDMEASGFYAAASRFSTSEIVHCVKVISDNPDSDYQQVDKQSVISLIESRMNDINSTAQGMMRLAEPIVVDSRLGIIVNEILGRYHFSETQKNTLKLLIRNLYAILSDDLESALNEMLAKNGADYLRELEDLLASRAVTYR